MRCQATTARAGLFAAYKLCLGFPCSQEPLDRSAWHSAHSSIKNMIPFFAQPALRLEVTGGIPLLGMCNHGLQGDSFFGCDLRLSACPFITFRQTPSPECQLSLSALLNQGLQWEKKAEGEGSDLDSGARGMSLQLQLAFHLYTQLFSLPSKSLQSQKTPTTTKPSHKLTGYNFV